MIGAAFLPDRRFARPDPEENGEHSDGPGNELAGGVAGARFGRGAGWKVEDVHVVPVSQTASMDGRRRRLLNRRATLGHGLGHRAIRIAGQHGLDEIVQIGADIELHLIG